MSNNIKLLLIFSFLIIIGGVVFVLIGLQSSNTLPQPLPSVISVVGEDSQSVTLGVENNLVLVTKVVDGDTVKLETGETVRLLGVDTPETVDPRRPVGCFGKEASKKLKELVEGKRVILEKDVSETDTYKRLLRFIYLPVGEEQLFVNDYLIREGYGKVLTIPPDVKFAEEFLEAQRQARENRRGLWGSC